MKAKMKFDVGSIKNWLLENGEKLVFGIAAIVALGFSWTVVSRETLDASQQPDKMQQAATDLTNHVANSNWDPTAADVKLIDYEARVKRREIPLAGYELKTPLKRSLVEPKSLRIIPKIFSAEDIRVASGHGVFALVKDNSGRRQGELAPQPPRQGGGRRQGPAGYKPSRSAILKGQPWVVITALVPKLQQDEEFAAAFEQSAGYEPSRDTPQYVGCVVQRAEVTSADPSKLEWTELPMTVQFESLWEGLLPDTHPRDFIDPTLTMQLGPLVGTDWDDTVSHPVIQQEVAAARAAAEAAQAEAQQQREAPASQPGQTPQPFRGAAQPPSGQPAQARQQQQRQDDRPRIRRPPIKYRLLRTFDFTVEPNKKYRYRVRLALKNPNYKVKPQHLKNPEVENTEFVFTDWSEPSSTVGVPEAHRVLSGVVVKPATRTAEPQARVMITAIDGDEGIEAGSELDITRGSLANKHNVGTVVAKDPRDGQTKELNNIDFQSGSVVLDIRGGQSSSLVRKDRTLTSPGEVLILDSGGNLAVRNEFEDRPTYEERLPGDQSNPLGKDAGKAKGKAK